MSRKPATHRVTLARVARESRVSVTTASLILSGRPECLAQFQAQTIERVRRSAEQLGYRANLFASSLLAERSSFFALVIRGGHCEDPRVWHYGAYESELLWGVTETAPSDVYPIVAMDGPQISESRVHSIERIIAGGVFGTVVRTPNCLLETCLRSRMERGHPTVVVFPESIQDWPENAVDVDNVAVGAAAGKLLAGGQAKRWMVLRDAVYHAGQELREEGCRSIGGEVGAEIELVELPADLNLGALEEYLQENILELRPDGVFGMTIRGAVSAVRSCSRAGIVPGRDMALVGCDCAFWMHSHDPRITSVDVSWFDAGAAAMRELIGMTSRGESRFPTVLLPPRVVEGDTCPTAPRSLV